MRIARRLFVVPLANNAHGKTTILKALVSQGGDPKFDRCEESSSFVDKSPGPLD